MVIAATMALAACSTGGTGATTAPATITPATAVPASAAAASAAPASAAAGSPNAVTIADFAFAPGTLTVAAGTTVTWTNNDTAGHTVTADDGSFDSKTLANGATFSQAFAKAGTYTYHCNIHSSMTATVVVQ
jgi:plastocyanin